MLLQCASWEDSKIIMRTFILFALIGATLAVPKSTQRIVGGTDTNVETHPYMSNMQRQYDWGVWEQACGGTLITAQHVLSAAHCYVNEAPSSWFVLLGTSSRNSGGNIHFVSRINIHSQYDWEMLTNDVAIIHLFSNAVLSNTIQPARLAGAQYDLPDNTQVTAIGWGDLRPGGPASNILQEVQVNVINQEICASRYAHLKTLPGFEHWPDVTSDMFCAGNLDVGGRDACQGDSGGPAIHNGDILVGVVSWGYSCADSYYPGVLSRVSHNIDWIQANT